MAGLIVITDEQTRDAVPPPQAQFSYMINVASNKNGVGYGKWTHIDGFSEGVIRYRSESESGFVEINEGLKNLSKSDNIRQ